ncbi:MAG: ROK family protein [Fusobacteriaceae bacterium]
MSIVAIDIGGTEIKYSLISKIGELKESHKILTESHLGVNLLLEKIYIIIDGYLKKNNLLGIAISSTGQIDGTIGKVIGGNPIIPGWIGTNLVEILEKKYKLPAILENDVNCAAIGELWTGAAKEEKNFICLTLGTGIGGGLILNGDLFRGENNVAGEFGHIQIERNGVPCSCGKTGCYEKYASTSALVEMVLKKTGNLKNGKEIFDEMKLGNKLYEEIVLKWIDYITDGLSTLIYIFNPSLILLGGGVSKQKSYLLDMINKNLDTKITGNFKKNLRIEVAKNGNNAGVLGATYLLLKKIEKI